MAYQAKSCPGQYHIALVRRAVTCGKPQVHSTADESVNAGDEEEELSDETDNVDDQPRQYILHASHVERASLQLNVWTVSRVSGVCWRI